MRSNSAAQLEDIITDTGGCGKFQVLLSVIVHCMKCIVCFSLLFMVFGAAVPDWWCLDDMIGENITNIIGRRNISQYKSCKSGNETETCSTFAFDGTIRTVISEVNYKLVASMSGVVQGGVVEVVGSNLARGKIFTASIGSIDLLYPSVFIYCVNLHQFLILCSSKAMMFVKLYFLTSEINLISLVSLDPSGFHLQTK